MILNVYQIVIVGVCYRYVYSGGCTAQNKLEAITKLCNQFMEQKANFNANLFSWTVSLANIDKFATG